jgi:hypothetical protein
MTTKYRISTFLLAALMGSTLVLTEQSAEAAGLYSALEAADGYVAGTVVKLASESRASASTTAVVQLRVALSSVAAPSTLIEVGLPDPRFSVDDRVLLLVCAQDGQFSLSGGDSSMFWLSDFDETGVVTDVAGDLVYGFAPDGVVTEATAGKMAVVSSAGPDLPVVALDLASREPIPSPIFAAIIEGKLLTSEFVLSALPTLESYERQVLAEATCTAIRPSSGWTFAIERRCSSAAPTCEAVCAYQYESQAGWLSCFNSLHLYGNAPSDTPEQLGLKTYRYNGCGGGCGPNFCCCGN